MTGGPYGQTTDHDHVPLDGFGGAAGAGADAADNSAHINVSGANDVAANANAESQEIAAVPDPHSPEGQAAILAIIEKYQEKSVSAVEGSAASEQANGAHAAGGSSHHNPSGSSNSPSGGSGPMDILSGLLSSAGSILDGMSPSSDASSPSGSGTGAAGGAKPDGAHTADASSPADPSTDPLATNQSGTANAPGPAITATKSNPQ